MKTNAKLLALLTMLAIAQTACNESSTLGTNSKQTGTSVSSNIETNQLSAITTSNMLTNKKWHLRQVLLNGKNTIEDCQLDNVHYYDKNGEAKMINPVLCKEEKVNTFKNYWFIESGTHNKVLVIIDGLQKSYTRYTIQKLNASTMVLSPASGIQMVFTTV